MSAAELTGESFARDPAFDLERFVRRSFETFQEEPIAVVLRFAASVAEDVAEFVVDCSVRATDGARGGPRRRNVSAIGVLETRHGSAKAAGRHVSSATGMHRGTVRRNLTYAGGMLLHE